MRLDPEFRRGWAPLFAATVGMMLGVLSLPIYLVGSTLPALSKEFGWTFGQMTLGVSILIMTTVVVGPVAGQMADRYGARPLALASLVFSSFALASLALNPGSLTLYYLSWSMLGILGVGTVSITWTRVVSQWFERHKGLALGICTLGPSLIGALVRPFFPLFVEEFGWRMAFLVMAAAPLFIAFPIAFFALRDPPGATSSGKTAAPQSRADLAAALRNYRFWVIALPLFPISLAFSAVTIGLELIMKSANLTPTAMVLIAPLPGVFGIVGRLVSGWLLDRFWAPAVAFISFTLGAAGFLLIATGVGGVWGLVGAFAFVGLSTGSEYGIMAYLVARYFPARSYGGIYAAILSSATLGGAVGPTVLGRSFDSPGSFTVVAFTLAGVLAIVATAYLTLGKYANEKKAVAADVATEKNAVAADVGAKKVAVAGDAR